MVNDLNLLHPLDEGFLKEQEIFEKEKIKEDEDLKILEIKENEEAKRKDNIDIDLFYPINYPSGLNKNKVKKFY